MKHAPTLEAKIFSEDFSENEREKIKQQIVNLPMEHRQAIELHFFQQLSRKQIAAQLNWSYSKVHNRITRGITLLKAELNPAYFDQMRKLATALHRSSYPDKATKNAS